MNDIYKAIEELNKYYTEEEINTIIINKNELINQFIKERSFYNE